MPQGAAQRIVQHAAKAFGTEEAARRMQISEIKLRAYMSGLAAIPDEVLLRAVDLLTEDLNSPASQSPPKSQPDL